MIFVCAAYEEKSNYLHEIVLIKILYGVFCWFYHS